ncbi:MAG: HTH-type transcriptional repressor FabR [Alteromonadaceae bacterium]|nr:HTH-type transcriptional repressor FabR [Alteromonadaceae bacterium]
MSQKVTREQQKQQTRQNIINAALASLDATKSLSAVSLREVARVAGIAPTSFYRHFKDIDELGLTLVDEAGLTLRQLMRSARRRISSERGAISISVDTFVEFVLAHNNVFRLLLREHTGTSADFRAAVLREIQHFTDELTDYIVFQEKKPEAVAQMQADAMVKIVFSAGGELLDASVVQIEGITERTKRQLYMVHFGATALMSKRI